MAADAPGPVGRLFAAALDLPPADREGFLAAAAADPAVVAEVRSLLGHDDRARAEAFLEGPPAPPGDPADLVGRSVGPYRVECEVGRGGFGTVYRAARDDGQFRGHVAVKVLRRGLDTDDVLRRFAGERQALAGLGQHPNVVTLLDGGSTPDGRPYFVMEYVAGEPVDRYCDRCRLPVAGRLRLFLTVCEAVQHAHRHLVVHRDLKPANVLVAEDGRVKLLDFGIAKFLDPAAAGRTVAPTEPGRAPLTPAYASPEQARGGPVDVTSDVYSLGVVVYELLTGQLPYPTAARDRPPEKPSARFPRGGTTRPGDATTSPGEAAARRAARPGQLRRLLTGDLDNIVLRAMDPEPGRRYPSVVELAQDVGRYLAGEPVAARGNPWGYRARKFVGRHAGALAAAAAAFLALAGVAGWAVVERGRAIGERNRAVAAEARADRRFGQVRELAQTFINDFYLEVERLPGSLPARELLVRTALEYLDNLSAEAGDDPSVLQELAIAYARVGDIQGAPNAPNLGQLEPALESYRRALAILDRLDGLAPRNDLKSGVRAHFLERVGDIQVALGRPADALASHQASLDLRRGLAGGDPAARRAVGASLGRLGNLRLDAAGDPAGALGYYRDALAVGDDLARADPADPDDRLFRAFARCNVGRALLALGRPAEALGHYQTGAGELGVMSGERPDDDHLRRSWAVGLLGHGDALKVLGRTDDALAAYRQGLAVRQARPGHPGDALARRDLATFAFRIGGAHLQLGSNPLPGRDHRDHLRRAKEWFGKSREGFEGMKKDGTFRPADEHVMRDLAAVLARCDEALAALPPAPAPPPGPP